jgi:hypothetical protein
MGDSQLGGRKFALGNLETEFSLGVFDMKGMFHRDGKEIL